MKGRAFHAHPSLAAAADEASSRAQRTRRSQWLSTSERIDCVDALAVWRTAEHDDRFYWEIPSRGEQVAAFGTTRAIELDGADRFETAASEARRLCDDLHVAAPCSEAGRVPILVGGFAFNAETSDRSWEGFPAGRLVLPESVLYRSGNSAWLSVYVEVTPGCTPAAARDRLEATLEAAPRTGTRPSTPIDVEAPEFRAAADAPHGKFEAGVAKALSAIASGDLEKVVLARSVTLQRKGGFDPASILHELRRLHPACASFAVARRDAVFLGATPERLLELEGLRVWTAAVAGSAPRGRSPEEDRQRAHELTESKKEQAEHAVVVRALHDALAPLCSELEISEAPRLLQLEGIQHLETPIRGLLREEASLLELAGRLHPTPAVGGTPREAALAWLDQHEDLERGWYAGPVGVIRRDGGGELWVALRSALLGSETARLFVGAGIVSGAEPHAELRETQLKLRTMLNALVDL